MFALVRREKRKAALGCEVGKEIRGRVTKGFAGYYQDRKRSRKRKLRAGHKLLKFYNLPRQDLLNELLAQGKRS